MEMHDEIIVGM